LATVGAHNHTFAQVQHSARTQASATEQPKFSNTYSAHTDAPLPLLYFPVGQSVHSVDPFRLEYFPALHESHTDALLELYFPAGQMPHSDAPLLL
jgi:hypothetical protein